jgi:hypothetical protein
MDKGYKSIVDTNIEELVGATDFKNGNFNINEIKEQIKELTGAIPSVQVKWNTIPVANEDKLTEGQPKTRDIVEAVTITWLDSDNIPHELKYLI